MTEQIKKYEITSMMMPGSQFATREQIDDVVSGWSYEGWVLSVETRSDEIRVYCERDGSEDIMPSQYAGWEMFTTDDGYITIGREVEQAPETLKWERNGRTGDYTAVSSEGHQYLIERCKYGWVLHWEMKMLTAENHLEDCKQAAATDLKQRQQVTTPAEAGIIEAKRQAASDATEQIPFAHELDDEGEPTSEAEEAGVSQELFDLMMDNKGQEIQAMLDERDDTISNLEQDNTDLKARIVELETELATTDGEREHLQDVLGRVNTVRSIYGKGTL